MFLYIICIYYYKTARLSAFFLHLLISLTPSFGLIYMHSLIISCFSLYIFSHFLSLSSSSAHNFSLTFFLCIKKKKKKQNTYKTTDATGTPVKTPYTPHSVTGFQTLAPAVKSIDWLGQHNSLSGSKPPAPAPAPSPSPTPLASRPSSRNSESRSGFTYAEMIREAITSSASGQMFLFQIYEYLQTHFGCFRNAVDQNWKNSVRHSLSINPLFKRVEPAGGAAACGNKRKATAGLWTMRNTAEIAKPIISKRKMDEDWATSPTMRSKPTTPLGSISSSGTNLGITMDDQPTALGSRSTSTTSSGSASPVDKSTYAMDDRDVAEMLMALASGHYLHGSPSPTPASTPAPTSANPVGVFVR